MTDTTTANATTIKVTTRELLDTILAFTEHEDLLSCEALGLIADYIHRFDTTVPREDAEALEPTIVTEEEGAWLEANRGDKEAVELAAARAAAESAGTL